MSDQPKHTENEKQRTQQHGDAYDYSNVKSIARIALYDDLLSAPHVTEIKPAPTGEFIESLSTAIYEQSKQSGGTIPYTVIREVAENFIHAQFREATVSILDNGNTIRFADQGPGIHFKEKVQLPGFTSATEPMKSYIRGVGSGLPIVKEYLEFSHGNITIEDNLGTGAVVTISLKGAKDRPSPTGENDANEDDDAAAHAMSLASGHGSSTGIPPAEMPAYGIGEGDGGAPLLRNNAAHHAVGNPAAPYNPYRGSIPPTTEAPQYIGLQQAAGSALPADASARGYEQPTRPAYLQPAYAQMPSEIGLPGYQSVARTPQEPEAMANQAAASAAGKLSQRERDVVLILAHEGVAGVTDVVKLTGFPQSSTFQMFAKLEDAGLVAKAGSKRSLTEFGYRVACVL